jgi:hypothetical protein
MVANTHTHMLSGNLQKIPTFSCSMFEPKREPKLFFNQKFDNAMPIAIIKLKNIFGTIYSRNRDRGMIQM